MKKNVFQRDKGVKISFGEGSLKQNIVKMVENCSTGACDCMSDKTKAKITDMKVSGTDGDVQLELVGDISKEEIEKALSQSVVIE